MTTMTIKFSRITEEYIIEVRINGIRNESRDYFTSDLDDATATIKQMCNEARARGEDVP